MTKEIEEAILALEEYNKIFNSKTKFSKIALAALKTMKFIENSVIGKQKLTGEYAYAKFQQFLMEVA